MYCMCCWYIITGNVILCYFFSVAPFAPLLKYTCYMCNRQGAHKSHRISSSLCSHDNALLYLYWYLHFMLIWPWCILSYVWWEAIKPFWIWIWIWKDFGTTAKDISNNTFEASTFSCKRNNVSIFIVYIIIEDRCVTGTHHKGLWFQFKRNSNPFLKGHAYIELGYKTFYSYHSPTWHK